MKKILLSILVVALVATIAVGVTRSYFSDTETSSNNTFTAGKLDLKVADQCTYNGQIVTQCNWAEKDLSSNDLLFNYADVMPGDSGENTIHLKAVGSDAYVCGYIKNLANNDNGLTGPESKIDSTDGVGNGELQSNLYMTIWKDADCDNILDEGSPASVIPAHCTNSPISVVPPGGCDGIPYEGCLAIGTGGCAWVPEAPGAPAVPGEQILVNNATFNNGAWSLGQFAKDQQACLGISWNIPNSAGNMIQTDSVTGDVAFYAAQVKNNTNFVCPVTMPTE
jgi:predicted ribosomally synthesized peptide with SipW-like signal peptide